MVLSRSGGIFDRLARRYDLGNRVVGLGQDLKWKRRAVAAMDLQAGGTYVDMGAGTGDLARMMVAQLGAGGSTGRMLAMDASLAMLQAGAQSGGAQAIVGDAQALCLRTRSVDGVASGFLLRNLPDPDLFLAETARVLKPGGRLALLEICYPGGWLARQLFRLYFHGVAPLLGGLVTGQWRAYRYLSRSLRGFAPPERWAERAGAHGLNQVSLRRGRWAGLFLLVLEKTSPSDAPREAGK